MIYDDELCEKDQLEATDLGAEPDVSFESAYPSGGRSRLQLTPAHYHPHESPMSVHMVCIQLRLDHKVIK